MARKSTRNSARLLEVVRSSPGWEIIADVEDLRKALRSAVVKVLGDKSVAFDTPRRVRGNREVSSLTRPGATIAKAKYEYRVIPFLTHAEKNYWLASTVEVEHRGGTAYLAAAAVLLFEGDATDSEKIPLLRAEWAHTDNPSLERHAQPHWHVYAGRLTRSLRDGDEFITPAAGGEFVSGGVVSNPAEAAMSGAWEAGEFFHFAMCSRWHERDEEDIYVQITSDRLQRWLEGCIAYIRSQIEYLHGVKPVN